MFQKIEKYVPTKGFERKHGRIILQQQQQMVGENKKVAYTGIDREF